MVEYGISFLEIEERWTDRQFMAILDAMNKRLEKVNKARGVNRTRHADPASFAQSASGFSYKKVGG
jgi:hypothetical protein